MEIHLAPDLYSFPHFPRFTSTYILSVFRLKSGSKTNLLRHIRRVHDDIGEPSDNDLFPVLEEEGRAVSSEQDKENINSNSSSPNLRPESNDTTNKPINAPAKLNYHPSIFDEDEIAEKDADTAEPNVEDDGFELFSFLERGKNINLKKTISSFIMHKLLFWLKKFKFDFNAPGSWYKFKFNYFF